MALEQDSLSFLDDPHIIDPDSWLVLDQVLSEEFISNNCASFSNTISTTITALHNSIPTGPVISSHPSPSNSFKKCKAPLDAPIKKASQKCRKTQSHRRKNATNGGTFVKQRVPNRRPCGTNRWAVQLLNQCAAAITARNWTQVQHLLYVLHELASPTGDANQSLLAHGLRALTFHLSSSRSSSVPRGAITFASAEPEFFRESLMNFNHINPWFTVPNYIANSSILQILKEQEPSQNLHIVDIGISHGLQWPTLLDALIHRPGGPPPLVRITVVAPLIENNNQTVMPFATAAPGYNFVPGLLKFAEGIKINLQITRLDHFALQDLNAQVINSSPHESLIVSTQFILHHLDHNHLDNRSEFLRKLRSLEPKGLILSENNMDCSCNACGSFATGFSRRVDYLWRFLDSTSAAFKGGESEERRTMEGEAAGALMINSIEMNESKEKWCNRMREVGFVGNAFGKDTIDGAWTLLRKYDSNWEMRVDDKDGCVGLWWKGQPVSFCSLWKA